MNISTKFAPRAAVESADDRRMYAQFLCACLTVDRDNELVPPDSLDANAYLRNPILLWQHDHKQLPIGTAVGPDGIPMVEQTRDYLRCGFYFSRSNPMGEVAFGLVAEGILRGASIAYLPSGKRQSTRDEQRQYRRDRPFLVITPNSALIEVSLVNVPANPMALVESDSIDRSALADVIERGRLRGKPVPKPCMPALKALTAAASPGTTLARVNVKINVRRA